jgi:flagellum-specific peptidoglycan hydrolase FlgJ
MTFRPTNTPQPVTPVVNNWKGVVAAASKAGAKYPQVVAAQWALESGYGKHISGTYNYFGLKGSGTDHETKEFIDGKWITITAGFLNFPDLQSCVSYLVQRWYKDYKNYKGVNRASSAEECCRLLVQERYATDPQYAEKLIRLMRDNV